MTEVKRLESPLNEVQLMLLRLFSRPTANTDVEAIRKLLLNYYNNALQDELDNVIKEKNITRPDFEKVLNKQQRSK